MSAAAPFVVCSLCGKDAEQVEFDSYLRRLFRCSDGHETMLLPDDSVLMVWDEKGDRALA